MANQSEYLVERNKFRNNLLGSVESRIMDRVLTYLGTGRNAITGAVWHGGVYGQVGRQVSGPILEQTWSPVLFPIESQAREDCDG